MAALIPMSMLSSPRSPSGLPQPGQCSPAAASIAMRPTDLGENVGSASAAVCTARGLARALVPGGAPEWAGLPGRSAPAGIGGAGAAASPWPAATFCTRSTSSAAAVTALRNTQGCVVPAWDRRMGSVAPVGFQWRCQRHGGCCSGHSAREVPVVADRCVRFEVVHRWSETMGAWAGKRACMHACMLDRGFNSRSAQPSECSPQFIPFLYQPLRSHDTAFRSQTAYLLSCQQALPKPACAPPCRSGGQLCHGSESRALWLVGMTCCHGISL